MPPRFVPGTRYRFSDRLVRVFIRAGWGSDHISPTMIFTFTDYDSLGAAVFKSIDVRGDERRWSIDPFWWDQHVRELTLAEKEQIRMSSEPWNKRRDDNLRDTFRPK